jgi:hypothetical protein
MLDNYIQKLVLPMLLSLPIANAMAATAAQSCAADLEDAARFITANDAGASALLEDHGALIGKAFDKALADAAQVADPAACDAVLRTYLRAWRPGHLAVAAASKDAAPGGSTARPDSHASGDPRAPQFKVLGKDTVLLVFPTFGDRYGPAIANLLSDHRAELESHKNWIVDVRANGGGSDSTFDPVLGWLLDGDVPVHRAEYFVTPANIKATEEICAVTSNPKSCSEQLDPIARSMRAAAPGSFVLGGDKRIFYDRPSKLEAKRPARVAVLIDHGCGSSCEQFVLQARPGFRVKLVGRPTFGAIDYSNLRPHPLPSGRVLYYATTRTARLPDMRIDGIGIAPDILLPKPDGDAGREAEVLQVQRWLEGGSLGAE